MSLATLETLVAHALGAMVWLDGGSAGSLTHMRRVDTALRVEADTPTPGVRWHTARGRTTLWRADDVVLVDGRPSEADLVRPAGAPVIVDFRVVDSSGRFNPRRARFDSSAGSLQAAVLYPSLAIVRPGRGGTVSGSLRLAGGSEPLPWALVSVSLTDLLGEERVYATQAGASGDFILALPSLPHVGTDEALALRLTVRGDPTARSDDAVDPDRLAPLRIGVPDVADEFSEHLDIALPPGAHRRLTTSGRDYLALQVA